MHFQYGELEVVFEAQLPEKPDQSINQSINQ